MPIQIEGKMGDDGVQMFYNYPCVYDGDVTDCNAHIVLDKLSAGARNFISRAAYFKILANFGKGAESLTVTKEKFPNVK